MKFQNKFKKTILVTKQLLKNQIAKNITLWKIVPLASLLAIGLTNPVLAKKETTEIEEFCFRNRHNSVCKDRESYISLEKWNKNKTLCSLATEWKNEERKCKVVASDRELTVYVENGVVSEFLPNTFKTTVMTIDLDDIFAFDTQWWLADVAVSRINESSNSGSTASSSTTVNTVNNAVGVFTDLQIGFIPNSDSSEPTNGKFLNISAKNLHQILEQMEAWRYYLPDLTTFEQKLKSKTNNQEISPDVSGNIAQLKQTNECPDCDLKNANLAGLDLENANLQGANLAGANLAETKLKQAYLLGANLERANLDDANLETANLMFASLNQATLIETNLKGANLQNTSLNNANLSGATLKAKDFKVTSLKNANLNGANLTDANLKCVNFQSASLKNANLTNANLSVCKKKSPTTSFQLSTLRLNNAGVPYTFLDELVNAVSLITNIARILKNPSSSPALILTVARLEYSLASNLSGANLNGANLTGANLSGVNLTDINLSNVIMADTKLSANNLSNANFINTDVSEVDFKNPVLICEATFSDESIYEEYCQEEEEEEEE